MERDGQRLAEPDRSAEDERHVERDEGVGDVTPRRAVDDEAAETSHQKCQERDIAPLAGRYPHLAGEQDHGDNAEVGGIEEVLAVESNDELAGDGGDGRGERQALRTWGQ